MVKEGYVFSPGYGGASILWEIQKVSVEPDSEGKRYALEELYAALDKERQEAESRWEKFGSAPIELTDFLNNTSFASAADVAQKVAEYFKQRNPDTTVTPGKLEKMMEIHSYHDHEFSHTRKRAPRDDFIWRVLVVESSKDYPTK